MLALSIFCSSHRISVALSEGKKLQIYHEKKIKNGKVEGLFTILTKFQKCNALNNLKYVLFANGPGSFTGIRSIKSICQALTLSNNAKIHSISTFFPYLIKEINNDCEVVVTYRSSGTNFFFKHFQIKKRKIIEKSKLFVADIKNIESFFEKKKKINNKIFLVTDDQDIKKFFKNAVKLYSVNAKDLLECFLNGYSNYNQDIFYHNTYYE
tara:strand:+ start:3584 stop:4213 length:630 start_codon:yes stop_codon:yes gene_type:complete